MIDQINTDSETMGLSLTSVSGSSVVSGNVVSDRVEIGGKTWRDDGAGGDLMDVGGGLSG